MRSLRRRYGRSSSQRPLYFEGSPRRVEILKSDGRYFKPGQFGYVLATETRGGMHCQDTSTPSRAGEPAYLVSKTKDMRGGALWFSADGVRFTRSRSR